MTNAREECYENIMMVLMGEGFSTENVRNGIQMILGKYEITDRCTEVALPQEDRNEYLIKKFIMAKTVSGRTQQTIKYYSTILDKAIPMIGKTIDDITADDIRYYLAVRQRRDKVSKTTAGDELRVLRSFFQYLTDEEIIRKNPTRQVETIKTGKRNEVAFTDIEVEKIRDATRNNRERTLVEMLLSTGCRISELCQILISEIKDDKITVHGKGEKDRTVYLNAKAIVALNNYLDERKDDNPYLFPSGLQGTKCVARYNKTKSEWYKQPEMVGEGHADKSSLEQVIRRIGKRAGVDNVHPHRFRRTCATLALRRGMPIEKVSKMLGHEQLDTTKIYISVDEDEMEQAHRKYVV